MQYYDVVQGNFETSLATRLGFKHLFAIGSEVAITDNPGGAKGKKVILFSRSDGTMLRNLSQPNVIGAIITENKMQKGILEKLVSNEKPVFIVTKEITNAEQHQRIRRLNEARKTVRLALSYRAKVSLISLAENKEQIMSAVQMMELAKFIGLSPEQAKSALAYMARYS